MFEGKLSHLKGDVGAIQSKIARADDIEQNMDSLLDKRFAEVGSKLESTLKTLVDGNNSAQSATFSAAIQNAVLSLTQTQQILINSLSRISTEATEAKGELSSGIGGVEKSVATSNADIVAKMNTSVKAIEKSIKAIPVPKATDLSGLSKDVRSLEKAIKSIPKTVLPKQKDFSADIKKLMDMIKNRTHTFEVERNTFDDLVTSIKVTSE